MDYFNDVFTFWGLKVDLSNGGTESSQISFKRFAFMNESLMGLELHKGE